MLVTALGRYDLQGDRWTTFWATWHSIAGNPASQVRSGNRLLVWHTPTGRSYTTTLAAYPAW